MEIMSFWEWLEREVPCDNPLSDDIESWYNKQAEADKKFFEDEYKRYTDGMILKQDYE